MSKRKILITGSNGQLGHSLNLFLKSKSFLVSNTSLNVGPYNLEGYNLSVEKNVSNLIKRLKPDFIINCIGILVNGSQDKARAIYLNAYLPHQLKTIAKNINSKLIHISTDCVFSGLKG